MPVSLTSKCRTAECGMQESKRPSSCLLSVFRVSDFCIDTATITSPCSVNLTALPTRLISTWRRRVGVGDEGVGHVGGDAVGQFQALLVARRASGFSASPTQSRRCIGDRVQVELAGLDLREVEDVVEQGRAGRRPTTSPCPGTRAAPASGRCPGPARSCRGCRSSACGSRGDMLARNSLLSRLAASAASLARFSSMVLFFSVMSRKVTTTPPTAGSPVRSLNEASTTRTPPSGRARRTSAEATPSPPAAPGLPRRRRRRPRGRRVGPVPRSAGPADRRPARPAAAAAKGWRSACRARPSISTTTSLTFSIRDRK